MSTLEQDVGKAQATVDEWTQKAADARAEADRIDRESGAQILDNPDVAETVEVKVQAKRRQARAFESAAAEARTRVGDVYRKNLELEHRRLVKDIAAKRKVADDYDRKVAKLLSQLRELDGVDYEPVFGRPSEVAGDVYYAAVEGHRSTVGADLDDEVSIAEAQAGLAEHYLETEEPPSPASKLFGIAPAGVLAEVRAGRAAA